MSMNNTWPISNFTSEEFSDCTAIHDPLRDVDAGARNVCLFVQIRDFVDRTAVNSHSDPEFGMLLELLTNF